MATKRRRTHLLEPTAVLERKLEHALQRQVKAETTVIEVGCVLVGHGFDPTAGVDEATWLRGHLRELVAQRDAARAAARQLAHAYQHDTRPPADAVELAAGFPAPLAPGRIGAPP